MKRRAKGLLFLLLATVLAAAAAGSPAAAPEAKGWESVARILGKEGTLHPSGVYKVSFPRADLSVRLWGEELAPPMGLGSWAAFARAGDGRAIVTGDTCMLEAEVDAVVDALRRGGIRVVAVHNHMVGERPPVMFLHYQGRGDVEALARTIRSALDHLGKK